jgi:hypothetical protein
MRMGNLLIYSAASPLGYEMQASRTYRLSGKR